MKRSWIGLVAMAFLWGGMPVWAQSSGGAAAQQEESGTAVKLGNGSRLINTIVWGNQNQKQVEWEAGATVDTARCKIMNDPNTLDKSLHFRDSANYDFRLTDSSSCLDRGSEAEWHNYFNAQSVDLWMNPRHSGDSIDIGAHEYRTYKVIFIKPEQVAVTTIKHDPNHPGHEGEKTWECDSNAVRPGHNYTFTVDLNGIEGYKSSEVTVSRVVGGQDVPLTPDEHQHYNIENINNNVYVHITVTPPIFVTVEQVTGGKVRAAWVNDAGTPVVVPNTDETKWSMVVGENSTQRIRIDTVSEKGYYCVDVRKKEKAKDAAESVPYGNEVSVKSKVDARPVSGELNTPATGKGLTITDKCIWITGVFQPRTYTVNLKVINREMGDLSVVGGGASGTVPAGTGTVTGSMTVTYAPDLLFTSTATPVDGYALKSLMAYDADGSSNPKDLLNGSEKTAKLRLNEQGNGGLTIVAEYEKEKYNVSWTVTADNGNGDLSVDGYTPVPITGGLRIENVPYRDEITVQVHPVTGYHLKTGTLKAQDISTGDVMALPDAGGSYTVVGHTRLLAEFEKNRYAINVTSNLSPDNTQMPVGSPWFTAVTPASFASGNEVEYGDNFEITPIQNVAGYDYIGASIDNGPVRNVNQVTIDNVQDRHDIVIHYQRKEYQIFFTEPVEHGTLTLTRKPQGAASFQDITGGSPQPIVHFDEIKATVAVDEGYEITTFTIDGTDVTGLEGGVSSVSADVHVVLVIEPKKFSVTLTKLSGGTYFPNMAKVGLVGPSAAHSVYLEKSETTKVITDVPYGTVMQFMQESSCAVGVQYSATSATATTSAGTEDWMTGTHTVKEDVTVSVGIESVTETNTFEWVVLDNGAGHTVTASREDECNTGGGEIVVQSGDNVPRGSNVNVVAEKKNGYVLLRVTGEDGVEVNPVTFDATDQKYKFTYGVNADTKLTLKYVKEVTVRFADVMDGADKLAGITVEKQKKDGSWEAILDGDKVPAGTKLRVNMVAVAAVSPADYSVGLLSLKLDADATFNWVPAVSHTKLETASPVNKVFDIPEDFQQSVITFTGAAAKFYSVKYTAPARGTLGIVAGGETLAGGKEYWYPKGTSVTVRVDESTEGYEMKDQWVANAKYSAGTQKDTLHVAGTAPTYMRTLELDRNLDLSLAMGLKEYAVTFKVEILPETETVIPAGGALSWRMEGETSDMVAWSVGESLSPDKTGKVTHGKRMQCTFGTGTSGEYSVYIKRNNGTFALQSSSPFTGAVLKEPTTYTVRLLRHYQLCYEADKVDKVTDEAGNVVANCAKVDAGARFRVWSQQPDEGHECVRVVVVDKGTGADTLRDSKAPQPDDIVLVNPNGKRTIQYVFTMPAEDVKATAMFAKTRYNLEVVIQDVEGNTATTYEVRKQATRGNGVLATGNYRGEKVLEYGDRLWVTVELPHSTADTSWYEVEIRKDGRESDRRIHVEMGEEAQDIVAVVGKYTRSYSIPVSPAAVGVNGDVKITIRVIRRTTPLHLRVTPPNDQFCIHVNVDGQDVMEDGHIRHFRGDDVPINVPVGAMVTAWTLVDPVVPTGWELKTFYGRTAQFYKESADPNFTYTAATAGQPEIFTMRHDMIEGEGNIAAVWGLKKYPLTIVCNPPAGGTVRVTGTDGTVYVNGAEVDHGTQMRIQTADISLLPMLNPAYTLESITYLLEGGVEQTVAEAGGEYSFPEMTAPMTITANFKKIPILHNSNPADVTIWDADGNVIGQDAKVLEGTVLRIKAAKEGHDCMRLVATVDGNVEYKKWTEYDANGVIEVTVGEGFAMPGKDMTISAAFEPKKYDVTVVYVPSKAAFTGFDLLVNPHAADEQRKKLEDAFQMTYTSVLALDADSVALHPWYEGPVTATAVMEGNQGVTYDLMAGDQISVKGHVTVTVTAKRKQKTLYVEISEEAPEHGGNAVEVWLEDGTKTTLTQTDLVGITVDVGSKVVIQGVPAAVYTMPNEEAVVWDPREGHIPGGASPVGTKQVVIAEMPDTDVDATATFELKRYNVAMRIDGYGTMDVTGLLGKSGMSVDEVHLKSGKNDHDNTDRSVAHYRQLHITVAPRTPAYRLTSFTIGGRQVATSDTTIEVTGNVKILAQYTKYYKVEWETNTGRGDMYVLPRGEETADTCYPGYTEFTVGVDAQEGYRVKGIAWAGSSEECSKEGTVEIADNKGKYTLPPLTEDACYDTVRLRAEMEVIPCRLKVEVPEEDGWVTVAAGGQTVDVPAAGVVLDYWTELDITSGIHIPEGYKLDKMVIIDGAGNQKTYPLTNGQNQPIHWTMKGDAIVRLLIEPHMYKVNFVQPEFGRMTVRDVKADTLLKSGDEVMYRTPLLITVEPDDPVGYEIIRTNLKTCNYDGQLVPAEESDEMNRYDWEVKCDVEMISAAIQIRRWQVKWTIVAQDEDGHVIMDPNDQRLPAGEVEVILPDGTAVPHAGSPLTVDHYTVFRVSVRAFEKAKAIFKLNALEVDGAELETRDSSFMVEGNVAITVTFRMRQPYRFPVAFTPNGDEWNQTWKIDGFWQANREKNKLEIYNRAQQRIYKAQPFDNENGWEGVTDDGDIVPAGTYVYIFEDGEGEKFTGLVSVVRN